MTNHKITEEEKPSGTIAKSGTIWGKDNRYDPIEDAGYVEDGRGNRFRRTKVSHGHSIGWISGEFYLYGDLPPELVEFLPGKTFALEERYGKDDRRFPIEQELVVSSEQARMQYHFTR